MQFKLPLKISAIAGAVLAATALTAATPAAAQYGRCPYGYYYSYLYGCIPDAPAYNDIYGDPDYDVGPPVYDTFGFGGGRVYRGGNRGGGYHGGGTRGGGGGHGGGSHGGGHH